MLTAKCYRNEQQIFLLKTTKSAYNLLRAALEAVSSEGITGKHHGCMNKLYRTGHLLETVIVNSGVARTIIGGRIFINLCSHTVKTK